MNNNQFAALGLYRIIKLSEKDGRRFATVVPCHDLGGTSLYCSVSSKISDSVISSLHKHDLVAVGVSGFVADDNTARLSFIVYDTEKGDLV